MNGQQSMPVAGNMSIVVNVACAVTMTMQMLLNALPDLNLGLFPQAASATHMAIFLYELPDALGLLFDGLQAILRHELPDPSGLLFIQVFKFVEGAFRFSHLPADLRFKIWALALPHERLIPLRGLTERPKSNRYHGPSRPTIYNVNHESRNETLRIYQLLESQSIDFGGSELTLIISRKMNLINPAVDRVTSTIRDFFLPATTSFGSPYLSLFHPAGTYLQAVQYLDIRSVKWCSVSPTLVKCGNRKLENFIGLQELRIIRPEGLLAPGTCTDCNCKLTTHDCKVFLETLFKSFVTRRRMVSVPTVTIYDFYKLGTSPPGPASDN
ncbi:unnamed protein product [Diplocarpon coronariae]